MLGQAHVTEPPDITKKKQATVPGMASWGGEGPAGTTCRECSFWQFTRKAGYFSKAHDVRPLALKPQRCGLACRKLFRDDLPKIEHNQPSCKMFERENAPPSIMRPEKGSEV
jgi:hypothetical protein